MPVRLRCNAIHQLLIKALVPGTKYLAGYKRIYQRTKCERDSVEILCCGVCASSGNNNAAVTNLFSLETVCHAHMIAFLVLEAINSLSCFSSPDSIKLHASFFLVVIRLIRLI